MSKEIRIKLINSDAEVPSYASWGDAGADLTSTIDIEISPGERMLIPTGISIELPFGYEAQIRPRSGLAYKNGLTVLNAPGTIDSGYRGEIKVLLINLGSCKFKISKGMRIAQMVIKQVEQYSFEVVDSLNKTERGEGGFGSSGDWNMGKKTVELGNMTLIENKNPHQAASLFYNGVWVKNSRGEAQFFMFCESEIERAKKRTKRNPEDVPTLVEPSFFKKLSKLFTKN